MRSIKLIAIFVSAVAACSSPCWAVSPASVTLGRQLFERNWTPANPQLGGDGLGPLFNARSCAACHNQGGVGGGGDTRFNAITVGIERLDVTGPLVSDDVVSGLLRNFHPGFINRGGGMKNTMPLLHHGGTDTRISTRYEFLSQVQSEFSSEGGSIDPSEVRLSNATPILFSNAAGPHQLSLRARVYQRNTTALFGAGLIDQVSGRDIEAMVSAQKQHPEISGRPATLADGRYGKFGWRGNIASLLDFVDQACAAELGLQTRRKTQPADSMNPEYRNSTFDIRDEQIISMHDFIAMLPAPVRKLPADSAQREVIRRGEQAYAAIGCAVCHPAQMGQVEGLFSDLLLHDMGNESIDLSHAEPYIVDAFKPSKKPSIPFGKSGSSHPENPKLEKDEPSSSTSTATLINFSSGSTSGYGGSSASISVSSSSTSFSSRGSRSSTGSSRRLNVSAGGFHFVAPEGPQEKVKVVGGVQLKFKPTKFNQEWRTPPLWGLRDSAPYMHDGRAETVLESIAMHDGEAAGTRDRFLQLPLADRQAVLAFLDTLVAPPTAPQQAN